jgi:predicted Co/Zn/Cd cation transporter (cation efflux family)
MPAEKVDFFEQVRKHLENDLTKKESDNWQTVSFISGIHV